MPLKQSKRISASVSGLGGTIRVSLNYNLLKRCTPAEVQGVRGHELGHYVLNHIPKMLVFFIVLLAIGFRLVDRAAGRLLAAVEHYYPSRRDQPAAAGGAVFGAQPTGHAHYQYLCAHQ